MAPISLKLVGGKKGENKQNRGKIGGEINTTRDAVKVEGDNGTNIVTCEVGDQIKCDNLWVPYVFWPVLFRVYGLGFR